MPEPEQPNHLKQLEEIQSALYDKASAYNKIIVGLGYGGFFAAWSATKQHLSPKLLVASALCETVSLILFVGIAIWDVYVTNDLSIGFQDAVNQPGADLSVVLQTHHKEQLRRTRPIQKTNKIAFPVSAVAGLAGGMILICAFVAGLFRM